MRKLSALALVLLVCWTGDAGAIEFKNVRANYGPYGAPRLDNKLVVGDVYFLNFDISGLAIDKQGVAKYEITLEVFDPKGKSVFKDPTKKAVLAALGGDVVPESARVMIGIDQPPGKYKAVITVVDDGSKTPKQLVQAVELLPRAFAMIFVNAPALGITGQDYVMTFFLADMARDKDKLPKQTITIRVLDDKGKPTTAEPIISKLPDDVPAELRANLAKEAPWRVDAPMLLNRTGRFTVQVDVKDELAKKSVKFSYSLKVVDPSGK